MDHEAETQKYLYTMRQSLWILDGSWEGNIFINLRRQELQSILHQTSESSGVITSIETRFEEQEGGIRAVTTTTVSDREYTQESAAPTRVFCPAEAVLDYLAESGFLQLGHRQEIYIWSAEHGTFDLVPVEVLEETTFEHSGQELPAYLVSIVEQDVPIRLLVSPGGMHYKSSFPTIGVESRLINPGETIAEFSPMILDMG